MVFLSKKFFGQNTLFGGGRWAIASSTIPAATPVITTAITNAHIFPQAVEFRAEPRNLLFSTEILIYLQMFAKSWKKIANH